MTGTGSRAPAAGPILFDMDGTLIDSEVASFRAARRLTAAHGLEWTEADAAACLGLRLEVNVAALQARGVALPADEIARTLSAFAAEELGSELPWLPGAEDLLRAVAERGIPAALVTNSRRPAAERLLRAAPAGALRFAVTADDVTEGKPDPEPYRLALQRLGAGDRGIALEDSVPGAASAHGAGLRVWFVRTHAEPPAFASASVASLAEVDLDALLLASG